MKVGRRIVTVAFLFVSAASADMPPRVDTSGPPDSAPMGGFFATGPDSIRAEAVSLPAPKANAVDDAAKPPVGRMQIGYSRKADLQPSAKSMASGTGWTAAGGGYARVIRVSSPQARALRVGLRLETVPAGMRVRVASAAEWRQDGPAVELTDRWIGDTYATLPAIVWTPVTQGSEQVVEIWLPALETARELRFGVEDVSHIYEQLDAGVPKAALPCHLNYSCSTDANIQTWGHAVAKMIITQGGSSFLCSGALLAAANANERLFTSANHCLSTTEEAASLQFDWNYEVACNTTTRNPAYTRTQGAQLLFSNSSVDFTLVRITGSLPQGVTFLGWTSAELNVGEAVTGIHHPGGDPKAYSVGSLTSINPSLSYSNSDRSRTWTISANVVTWSAGLTQGGSSGSPLISPGGRLRGTVGGGASNKTCQTNPQTTYYTRFSEVYPLIRTYLETSAATPDEPNNAQATLAAQPTAYTSKTINAQINSAGDEDWFRFSLPQRGTWTVYTTAEAGQAAIDTVGRIYGSDGTTLQLQNDDDPAGAPNFRIVGVGGPGTFYVQVTGKAGATGKYVLVSQFTPSDDHADTYQQADLLSANGAISGVLERSGDSDYFYIDVATTGLLTIASSGATDVLGILYNSANQRLDWNDDVASGNTNFRISTPVAAGRYYLQVIGYDEDTTGAYSLATGLAAAGAKPNYTSLWWNDTESGWGVNVSHQGDKLFATLFTYSSSGTPLWLVMSDGAKQADGSFAGTLFRSTGPAFNAVPFTPITAANLTAVGTMRFAFSGDNAGTLTYSVNGANVTKAISRLTFAQRPSCNWSVFDRADATNYQDLWWNPSENGWGLNIAHQNDIVFATLYTYDSSGQGLWLFMSEGRKTAPGVYSGGLFRSSGPAFNAVPFVPITAANLTQVGTMTVSFANGKAGTVSYSVNGASVTKSIQRLVFAAPAPLCSQ